MNDAMEGAGQSLPTEKLRTEPLTLKALSEFFGLERHKMAGVLKAIKGIEKIGAHYRVPLVEMPPAYLLERDLLRPSIFSPDGRSRRFSEKPFRQGADPSHRVTE